MAKKKHKRNPNDPNCPMCAYCGVNPGMEDEHVVAEAFFPDPRPSKSEYIIVPACADCNRGIWKDSDRRMNMDEEYVRSMFILDWNAGNHPAARTLLKQKVIPSVKHSPNMPRLMFPNITRSDLELANGLLVPNLLTTSIHWPRVRRVLEKITRGLHYRELGRRFPDTHEIVIEVLSLVGMNQSPKLDAWPIQYLMARTHISGKRRLANGVFSYAFTHMDDNDPSHIWWVLGFYDGVYMLVVTRPKSSK